METEAKFVMDLWKIYVRQNRKGQPHQGRPFNFDVYDLVGGIVETRHATSLCVTNQFHLLNDCNTLCANVFFPVAMQAIYTSALN